jgi:hypothetical protein
MKKIIILAIILSACLIGCTFSGLDIKLDNASMDEPKLSE